MTLHAISHAHFGISRSAPEPGIVHWHSNGEMVEALPGAVSQAQGVVHYVVKVTPDTRGTHPRRFGSQIQALSDYARFPEQMPIRVRPTHPQNRLELSEHSQAKCSIGSDVLVAGHRLGEGS